MKSKLCLMLVLALVVSCFGCSKTPTTTVPIGTEPSNEATTEPTVELSSEVVSEEETQPSTEAPTENQTTEPVTEPSGEGMTEAPTQKPTEAPTQPPTEAPTEPEKLEGVLIENSIYGCGEEHTIKVNGVTFHWYDRYERRDYYNTTVNEYLDITSFSLYYKPYELSPSFGNNEWVAAYELYSSSDITFYWITYDKDGYYLDETGTGMYKTDGSLILSGWIKGKCRGESRVMGSALGRSTAYAEFYPFGL